MFAVGWRRTLTSTAGLPVRGHDRVARLESRPHRRDVGDAYRHVVHRRDDDRAEVVGGRRLSADERQLELVVLARSGPGESMTFEFLTASTTCCSDSAARLQPGRIDEHVVLAHLPARTGDGGHAGDARERRTKDDVREVAQRPRDRAWAR